MFIATRLTHQSDLVPQYVWEAHVFEAYFHIQKKLDAQLEYQLNVERLGAATKNGDPIKSVSASRSTDAQKLSDAHCTAIRRVLYLYNFWEKKETLTLGDTEMIPCIFTLPPRVKQNNCLETKSF